MRKIILTLGILVLLTNITNAQVSHLIRYQGVLTDKGTGQPKQDGSYGVIFRIYETSTSGSPIWQESKTIQLSSGTFSTLLGEFTPLNLAWDKDYWLSLQLSGESEMSQRQQITPVPTALRAERAQQLADSVYVDSETGNVGIGTPTPQATLDVRNSQTDTVLLLHCNGEDGSTTFVDQAGKAVTAQGDAQLRVAYGSGLFNGSGDYLSVPESDDWCFGTGDFTIDCWVYFNNFNGGPNIVGQQFSDTNYWMFATHPDGRLFFNVTEKSITLLNVDTTVPVETGAWHHVALVRNGNNFMIFIDGIQRSPEYINESAIPDFTASLWIAGLGASQSDYMNGRIDELRISKGTNRGWTQDFPDSLPTTMQVKDDYTKLLLHCDGKNGSANFTDDCDKIVTAYGNAHIDSSEYKINGNKFGTASGLFDGSGDYLSIPDSDDWDFGDGDFTIDFWVRFSDISEYAVIYSQVDDISNYMSLYIGFGGDPHIGIYFRSEGEVVGAFYTSPAPSWEANVWYHIAVVRNGSECYIFRNGESFSLLGGWSGTLPNLSADFVIGASLSDPYYVNGWIDELRISKGVALWKDTFPAPTKEYPFGGGNAIFSGRVGIGATEPTAALDLYNTQQTGYNLLRLRTSFTPSGTSDDNGNAGDIAWDDNFIYVKTPLGWKRAQLNTW